MGATAQLKTNGLVIFLIAIGTAELCFISVMLWNPQLRLVL